MKSELNGCTFIVLKLMQVTVCKLMLNLFYPLSMTIIIVSPYEHSEYSELAMNMTE